MIVRFGLPLALMALCWLPAGCSFLWDDYEDEPVNPCGNGQLDADEECDDGDRGNSDLLPNACRYHCTLPRCGDGVIDEGEECERAQPTALSCETFGYSGGVITCTRGCRLDTRECTHCGSGLAEGSDRRQWGYEACDGEDLRAASCESLGLGEGELNCTDHCTYYASGCSSAGVCGDGIAADPEECDDHNRRSHDGCSATCRWERPRIVDVTSPDAPVGVLSGPLVYDSARKRIVQLGVGGTHWEFDGVGWARRSPPVVPQLGHWHGLVYDEDRAAVVFYGGVDSARGTIGETWEFDGETWTRQEPMNPPTGRWGAGMTYDDARGVVVLFGGYGSSSASQDLYDAQELGDTWEYDGAEWLEVTPGRSPPPRVGPHLAHDRARGRTVLVGGELLLGQEYSDTWELFAEGWQEITPDSSPREWSSVTSAFVYDPGRRRCVLFLAGLAPLGDQKQVFEYDGRRYVETTPPERLISAYWLQGAVFDPEGKGLMLGADFGAVLLRYRWD